MNNSYQHRHTGRHTHTHTYKQQLKDRHKGHAYIFILTLTAFPGRILIPVADSHHRLAASLSPRRAFVYACHRLYRFFLSSLLLSLFLLLFRVCCYCLCCRIWVFIVSVASLASLLGGLHSCGTFFAAAAVLTKPLKRLQRGTLSACRTSRIVVALRTLTHTHPHTHTHTCTPTHTVNSLLFVAYRTACWNIFRKRFSSRFV